MQSTRAEVLTLSSLYNPTLVPEHKFCFRGGTRRGTYHSAHCTSGTVPADVRRSSVKLQSTGRELDAAASVQLCEGEGHLDHLKELLCCVVAGADDVLRSIRGDFQAHRVQCQEELLVNVMSAPGPMVAKGPCR